MGCAGKSIHLFYSKCELTTQLSLDSITFLIAGLFGCNNDRSYKLIFLNFLVFTLGVLVIE